MYIHTIPPPLFSRSLSLSLLPFLLEARAFQYVRYFHEPCDWQVMAGSASEPRADYITVYNRHARPQGNRLGALPAPTSWVLFLLKNQRLKVKFLRHRRRPATGRQRKRARRSFPVLFLNKQFCLEYIYRIAELEPRDARWSSIYRGGGV